jgi:hypothetical protein
VGSPLFLKNRYGAGYHLTLARSNEASSFGTEQVQALVMSHLPGTVLSSDVGRALYSSSVQVNLLTVCS